MFKLIPDWRLAWRFLSVQAAVLLALLSGLQTEVLPLMAPLFPDRVWPWVSGGLALAVVVLRLVAQDSLELERAQLELDAIDRATLVPPPPAMPAGRLERYLGAVLLLVALAAVLSIAAVAWLAVRGPSA
ncbi:MAG: hypothetical protein Q8S71_02280 [Hydrogenophaga sp.]|nr:hypothetical protein [Hydrogenophaga sp.]